MNFFVLGSIPGLFTFFTELIFHVNIVSFLQKFEIYRIDELFPAIIFPLIGFLTDYRIKLIKKKELEKLIVYRETLYGMNHLLRNVMNHCNIIEISETIEKEFGPEIKQQIKKDIKEVENIIQKLSELENLHPNSIRSLSVSNVDFPQK